MTEPDIRTRAIDVFGDEQLAEKWLREPLYELSNASPLDVSKTSKGEAIVRRILAQIEWGAAA